MRYKADTTTPYQNKITKIIDWAKARNQAGIYYPIWGTCLGMEESLISLDENDPNAMSLGINDINTEHPLDLTPAYWQSAFFKGLPISPALAKKVYKKKVFYYYHHEGLTFEHYQKENLEKEFNLLATSTAANGKRFVALMEGKDMPIYLTQFHPEKNQFEKIDHLNNLDRSSSTLRLMSSYMWRFIGLIKEQSKVPTPVQIPQNIHKYLSNEITPRNSPVKSYAKIYLLKNLKTVEPFLEKHKGVMRIWVGLKEQLRKEDPMSLNDK
jgi:imidazoleglycerol phosphate synthase glutamine amidotransferase subunit HisH